MVISPSTNLSSASRPRLVDFLVCSVIVYVVFLNNNRFFYNFLRYKYKIWKMRKKFTIDWHIRWHFGTLNGTYLFRYCICIFWKSVLRHFSWRLRHFWVLPNENTKVNHFRLSNRLFLSGSLIGSLFEWCLTIDDLMWQNLKIVKIEPEFVMPEVNFWPRWA